MKSILIIGPCYLSARNAWEKAGYNVINEIKDIHGNSCGDIEKRIIELMNKISIELVFNFNFNADIASICYRLNLIYVSWTYDSPLLSLWSKETRYSTNRIFIFDTLLAKRLQEKNIENVYHLPLGTDITGFESVIENDSLKSMKKYEADVAIVGNLYNDEKHDLFAQIVYLPPYVRGYIEALIASQRNVWGINLLDSSIVDSVWNEVKKYVDLELDDRYEPDAYEIAFKGIIGRHITKLERMQVCSTLADKYDFKLYTDCDTSYDSRIINKGHADYYKEMPLIFRYSKINIQITLRTIDTGISLRVLDVLACEGFLLTNYQYEIAQFFEDGKELVIYNDFEDLYNKIDYYLKHENERKAIARAGYKKVCKLFNYDKAVNIISKVVSEGDNRC